MARKRSIIIVDRENGTVTVDGTELRLAYHRPVEISVNPSTPSFVTFTLQADVVIFDDVIFHSGLIEGEYSAPEADTV
ncbi:hypothetical protein [Glaciihabitans sp. dw_435]|uniref:hypothetical protein n=1 Tax=Glaciihabitans sp. dw_435 TaxID=2720081 RepID=UPI001BD5FDE8|nr:hypothetical protein [Glaciihabitans sp. dw_435]